MLVKTSILVDMEWHSLSANEVISKLSSSANGLSNSEAKERLKRYGYNEIVEKKKPAIFLFLRQFANFLIIILLIATLISAFLLGEVLDAVVILLIVLFMAIMGFLQEYKAEKAMEALKKLATPTCKVVRDNKETEIYAKEVVPGDILILNEGDRIPADARLLETWNFEVDESALTGESTPVLKDAELILPKSTPLADRKNMVFMGTYVTKGYAKAIVVATGMQSEVGRIAKAIAEAPEEKTPLERELDYFGRRIGVVILLISLSIFITSMLWTKEPLIKIARFSIALAIAAIPEGLPAIATTVLAIGSRKMAKKNALVKRLAAVEALGSCNAICSDKTGTITKGEMTVKRIVMLNSEYEVSGVGYSPEGAIKAVVGKNDKVLGDLLRYTAAHTSVNVKLVKENGEWHIKGSTTEGAALVLAYKGIGEKGIEQAKGSLPLRKLIPFDRFRKRKTTIHKISDGFLLISSGAPELLLARCNRVINGCTGEILELDEDLKTKISKMIEDLASRGYRTYAIAYRVVEDPRIIKEDVNEVESNLIFFAVLAIIDPPREEVARAIRIAKEAGIRVIMVTGDHKLTAMAVARMIGLDVSEGSIIEGKELDKLSDEELENIVDKIKVYARVTPEHKARIVKALKRKGYVVAMTGDGVNDAPALKFADIGVAMGIRGTDVAKEASQLILLDDNFATIVEAVKQGRIIFENLKKPINYLLTCNFGEVISVCGAMLLLHLSPTSFLKSIHLLWINVTTDALPAIALGLEPAEPGIMKKSPRKKEDRFITNRKLVYYTAMGTLIATLVILLFKKFLSKNLILARTVAFTALAFSEFGRAFASRSENISSFRLRNNKWLWPALLISAFLQLIILYTPLHIAFNVVPLHAEELLLILIVPIIIFLADELRKLLRIRI